jgi:hypothetical protein
MIFLDVNNVVYVIFNKRDGRRTTVKCVVPTYEQAEKYMDQGYESICTCLENYDELKIIENELKVLEIIKKNNMIIPIKGSDNRCWLESQMLDAKRISQEEYDLLKEVLL